MSSTRTRTKVRRREARRRAPTSPPPAGKKGPRPRTTASHQRARRTGAPAYARALDLEALVSILDGIPARIAWLDGRRRFRFANREYAGAVRLAPEDLLGRSAAQVLGRANARHFAAAARAALEGESTHIEDWSRYPRTGWAYVDTLYAPVRRAGGRIDGYFVLVRDLTALKRREEDLARRTAQLEAILAGIGDGVSIIDAEGRLVLCNRGFLDLFGLPERLGAPGTPYEDIALHRLRRGLRYADEPPDRPAEALATERARHVREGASGREEALLSDGRRLEIRRQRLNDGTVVSTYADVTARHEAERARREQRDARREAQQLGAVASLLAGVAHEINNPLAVLAAQATLLEEDLAGTPFAARAEAVSATAHRCGRIVRSLTASARRRAPPRREAVAVRDALASALDLVGHRLEGAGVALTARLPADLPPLAADPDQLAHLLANLLTNAAAVLQGQPGPRRVTVSAHPGPGELVLRVADNGPGIPEDLRERVFDPFFTTKADGAGTGVGLALCRAIAHDHGGRIEASETPGGGATLTVWLPLHGGVGAAPATVAAEDGPEGC
jgi:PAS domain S-box-containing protein